MNYLRPIYLGNVKYQGLSKYFLVDQARKNGYRLVGGVSYPLMFSKRTHSGWVRNITIMEDGTASGVSYKQVFTKGKDE